MDNATLVPLSPIPIDALRSRVGGESDWAAGWGGSFNGSDARGGGAEFSPTSCPMSMSGFDGRGAGDLEAHDVALPGR